MLAKTPWTFPLYQHAVIKQAPEFVIDITWSFTSRNSPNIITLNFYHNWKYKNSTKILVFVPFKKKHSSAAHWQMSNAFFSLPYKALIGKNINQQSRLSWFRGFALLRISSFRVKLRSKGRISQSQLRAINIMFLKLKSAKLQFQSSYSPYTVSSVSSAVPRLPDDKFGILPFAWTELYIVFISVI